MGWIALVAFWAVAIRLWIVDGARVPLFFMALWVLGFFGFPLLGMRGYGFMAFETILAVILLVVEKVKNVL